MGASTTFGLGADSSGLPACLSVCLSRSFKLLLLFVSRWNRSIFWPSVLHVALYKTFSSIFDLGP